MQLVQALDRYVVVALDETARDVLVKRVVQDPLRRGGVGGMTADQSVPALFGVEHFRPQLAPGSGPGRAERRWPDPLDAAALAQARAPWPDAGQGPR